ncbi:family 20 glycosylhydrolase [Ruficoccus amylovorans]|uniref:Family 20 glycosylhydrolase n=1 Tax=Ruficoccus amylovorans TaxID=1804625 RepID=A0A842H9G1_9BACT|nr:beta-N-acetylhexosaminidase [Ruficoccus amylovorans]MBC2592905.1 family 20 glycosylhydrolase [Ruficoccus amylovorans]
MPRTLKIFRRTPAELSVALDEITRAFPHRFRDNALGWEIEFVPCPAERPGFLFEAGPGQTARIYYSQPAAAFRALGILMGQLESGLPPVSLDQKSSFRQLGAMLDVSRNGVLRLDTVKKLIRHFALIGINEVMLYTEDTYEIPGEPVFGYFRGGYSQEELKSIDNYAAAFGMEVIPCIQTLGHLEQVLQWPTYRHLKDTDGVLLAGDDETDAFVEKMIVAASTPFRSKRIHIGMDEAHGIGSGLYRLKNGLRPPFEILCEHLSKTVATCERHGLHPMIWSDMFFRLGSRTNNYYDRDSRIDPAISAQIPEGVELVYWDYYHTQSEFYDEWIDRHRQLGKKPLFAAGIWTWNRFWAQLPHSRDTLNAGMAAARREKLDEAVVTMWGDDGMECDIFSALPAVQIFGDLAYGQSPEDTACTHASNFAGSVDGTFDSWFAASAPALVPADSPADYEANADKWIFWHDPLLGFLEHQIRHEYAAHFKRTAEALSQAPANRHEDRRLDFPRRVASLLHAKCELHLTLRPAYQSNDLPTLRRVHDSLLGQLSDSVGQLRDVHESLWHENYRSFGWEVLERRYAGLLSRLHTLKRKLALHLQDPSVKIDELECAPQQLWPPEQTNTVTLTHRQTATPSTIA